jgi:hypothetical protein
MREQTNTHICREDLLIYLNIQPEEAACSQRAANRISSNHSAQRGLILVVHAAYLVKRIFVLKTASTKVQKVVVLSYYSTIGKNVLQALFVCENYLLCGYLKG